MAISQGRKRKMAKENRKYKDSVFVDIFYTDETAEENLLSLYNALHGTDLKGRGLIRKIKVDDVLYMNFKNDLSAVINHETLEFMEHQSTINPNIPLRMLLYLGRAYEQLIETKARYKTNLIKIPTPEFYLFYNGKRDYPAEQKLRLSDAYLKTPGENSVELIVTAININSNKAHAVLEKCKVLREYSLFIDTVRAHEKEEDGMEKAIKECIKNGVLAEYLKRRGSEVQNMLTAEYDYEMDIQVKQEEARQEGRLEERTQMIMKALTATGSVKRTAFILDLDERAVRDIAKEKNMPVDD